jgi:hypothetical protein
MNVMLPMTAGGMSWYMIQQRGQRGRSSRGRGSRGRFSSCAPASAFDAQPQPIPSRFDPSLMIANTRHSTATRPRKTTNNTGVSSTSWSSSPLDTDSSGAEVPATAEIHELKDPQTPVSAEGDDSHRDLAERETDGETDLRTSQCISALDLENETAEATPRSQATPRVKGKASGCCRLL